MEDRKKKKIVVAITVNAVILIFILLSVVIAQVIKISVLKRRKQDLLARGEVLRTEYATLDELYEKVQTDEEYYKWYLEYIEVFGDEDPQNILPDDPTSVLPENPPTSSENA